jgi:hypothetical protein
MLAEKTEQCLVELGFGFQVGQVPGAVEGMPVNQDNALANAGIVVGKAHRQSLDQTDVTRARARSSYLT